LPACLVLLLACVQLFACVGLCLLAYGLRACTNGEMRVCVHGCACFVACIRLPCMLRLQCIGMCRACACAYFSLVACLRACLHLPRASM
jgi:hypothetical protein